MSTIKYKQDYKLLHQSLSRTLLPIPNLPELYISETLSACLWRNENQISIEFRSNTYGKLRKIHRTHWTHAILANERKWARQMCVCVCECAPSTCRLFISTFVTLNLSLVRYFLSLVCAVFSVFWVCVWVSESILLWPKPGVLEGK